MDACAAGIDIGSATVKLAVINNERVLMRSKVCSAGFDPRQTALQLLASLPQGTPVVATGYGRALIDAPAITELKAHGIGAHFLFPQCTGVIDIGGQDVKVMSIDKRGRVARFEMNDRCAAGTGRFLEIMAMRLGYSFTEFSDAASTGSDTVSINSLCTVFAESEVIGLINKGLARQDIAAALVRSSAVRIVSMFNRIAPDPHCVVMSGGGAANSALVSVLCKKLGCTLHVSPAPQIAGALGCALTAQTRSVNNE